jgi:hypothetical protein
MKTRAVMVSWGRSQRRERRVSVYEKALGFCLGPPGSVAEEAMRPSLPTAAVCDVDEYSGR